MEEKKNVIYKVSYSKLDLGAYFGGSNSCYYTTDKYFTTEAKAKSFVNSEITKVINNRTYMIKFEGDGAIYEVEVE